MAMSNQEFIHGLKSTLVQITGNNYDIVGVPEDSWKMIREDYVANQKHEHGSEEQQVAEQSEDPLISKARELFGDELLEIKD